MVNINDYSEERECTYKGELYSVRDNGAVMRHQRDGQKVRKLDNVWTFGTKNMSNGYMLINSHRVHIIVAKAFIPGNEDGKMVVDHKDTNRCNNRVENLRWLTRLENVLLNEATLKRVTFLCGGDINKFINDPTCLRDLSGDNQDIMWMRTVTPEEAKKAWEHISAWSKRPTSTFKMMQQNEGGAKDFVEWLNRHKAYKKEPSNRLKNVQTVWNQKESLAQKSHESLTTGALQIGFRERMYFPLCPKEGKSGGLDAYARNLRLGEIIANGENGDEYTIESLGWTREWDAIQVEYKLNGDKQIHAIHISIEDGNFLHSVGSYKSNFRFCGSPNVLQSSAITQFYFPKCPIDGNVTLEEYAKVLQKDTLFETSEYGNGYVYDREITQSEDGTPILYIGVKIENPIKDYGDLIIFIENGKVIHQLGRTYFDEKYLQREFCRIRKQEWDEKEYVVDDYC